MGGTGFIQPPPDLSTSDKSVDMDEAWQGDKLTYDIDLNNTGGEDTGVLNLSDEIPNQTQYVDSSLTWSSGDAGYDPATKAITWTGVVTAGGSVNINFQVWVNGGDGTPFSVYNTAEVTSTETQLSTLPALSASTQIQNDVGFEFDGNQAQVGDPGEVVVYQHIMTNTSNYTDTFIFTTDSSQDWTTDVTPDVMLAAGVSTTIQVSVTIDGGTPAGVVDTTTITATSETYEDFTETVADTTTVNQVVTITVTSATGKEAMPGEVVTYTHTLTNDGNATDTFTITVSSDQAWTVSADPFTATLVSGASIDIDVVVVVPPGASHGTIDQTTLTVKSKYNPAVTISQIDVTTVVSYKIYLPLVMR